MEKPILVIGVGMAGLSTAKLLARHGYTVHLYGTQAQATPAIVVGETSLQLLQDIWDVPSVEQIVTQMASATADPSTFVAERLSHRQIRFATAEWTMLEQDGLVVRGEQLACQLRELLLATETEKIYLLDTLPEQAAMRQEYQWVVDAGGRTASVSQTLGKSKRYQLGERHMIGAEVENAWGQQASWIETVTDGWVFAAPLGNGRALLQAMVPAKPHHPAEQLRELLAQTRLIYEKVTAPSDTVTIFRATPEISLPLSGGGWLSVGDAACSFDPICGDGTGYALREAILAVAVINGIARGLPAPDCLEHYAARLQQTFLVHVQECMRYYVTAFGVESADWRAECVRMRQAFPVEEYQARTGYVPKFGLQGFELVEVG